MLVNRVTDPVDARIATNGLVSGIDQDDFEELVTSVLSNSVRVEHTKTATLATNTFLGLRAQAALELEFVDTLVGGLAHGASLRDRLLATTTLDTHSVNDIPLLSLFVTE